MCCVKLWIFQINPAEVQKLRKWVRVSYSKSCCLSDATPVLQVLGIVVGVLIQDHDVRQTEFQQLPYHRIFIMLLLELNAPEHVLETINFQTLTAFW